MSVLHCKSQAAYANPHGPEIEGALQDVQSENHLFVTNRQLVGAGIRVRLVAQILEKLLSIRRRTSQVIRSI